MINIAICDDEKVWLEDAVVRVNQYFSEVSDIPAKVHSFNYSDDLLDKIEDHKNYDLYILDVIMPGTTGIELGKRIRELDKKALIVYVTTSRDFAIDAYSVYAFNYLVKPLAKDKLYEVLEDAVKILSERQNKAVSVKTKNGVQQLLFDDIIYTELVDRCCCYYLKDGSVIVANQQRASFTDIMMPLLKDSRFCRCGASFVLNLYYVKSINKDCVTFRNGTELNSLPKNACSNVLSTWLDYWMEGDVRV